jgi:hypothetical protein
MKRVFRAPSVIPCDFLRSMLDAAGIDSMFKNESGSAATGNALPVPSGSELPWAWPEVWVNDEDFELASQIAADFQRPNKTEA